MKAPRIAAHVPLPAALLSRTAGHTLSLTKGGDAPKGTVLSYGLDTVRKQVKRHRNPAVAGPVYPGMTIQVRFTVKASSSRSFGKKVDQEKRDENRACPGHGPGVAKGIVKFLVDVFDETGETVAIATILTMVKKLDQS